MSGRRARFQGGAIALTLVASLVLWRASHADQRGSCESVEYRAFDFWLGAWSVHSPPGTVVGSSRIERSLDGCALTEAWSSGTSRGSSISFYDASTRRWHQTYIDNAGRALLLDGGAHEGAMVLEGTRSETGGVRSRQRLTWSRLTDGRVRQHWQSSRDDGRSWQTVFDATYVPTAKP